MVCKYLISFHETHKYFTSRIQMNSFSIYERLYVNSFLFSRVHSRQKDGLKVGREKINGISEKDSLSKL